MKPWVLGLPALAVGAPLTAIFLLGEPAGQSPSELPTAPPAARGELAPAATPMEELARREPVHFLEECLRRYERDVHGYRCVLHKQERIAGRLQPRELIDVCFRERPHSVLFRWREGARKAEAVLYVEGQN